MTARSRPLKWHGGKSYLARQIIELMPSHTRYCEPFFGGGAVLFARSGEGVAEFVNDLNGDLANFWHVLRTRRLFRQFQWSVENTPVSHDSWNEARKRLEDGPVWSCELDRIERAVAFFVKYRQSRQALGTAYCTPTARLRRGMNENVSAWLSAVDGLPEAHDRLQRVEVWNQPAIECIDKLDSPDTLFYLDPPYLHETRASKAAYRFEMSDFDHACLLARLCDPEIDRLDCFGAFVGNRSDSDLDELIRQYRKPMHGRFLLSGYRSGLYGRVADLHAWAVEEVEIDNKASSKSTKARKIECVWMNYFPDTEH